MKIYQVDAFAEGLFQGNPAAVVPLTGWLPETVMQNIAMENNLAETAFIVPRQTSAAAGPDFHPAGVHGDYDYLIRWFTPTVEVELCGHATLASGHVVFHHLGFDRDEAVFRSLYSGDLKVMKGTDAALALDFPADMPRLAARPGQDIPFARYTPQEVEAIFDGLHIAPRELYRGRHDFMVVLDDQLQVEALAPDFRRLALAPARGIVVTAPGKDADFVSRCFFPQSGIDEDPVTGSAHTMMIPFWAERLGKNKLSAIQLSRRKGHLDCTLSGDRVFIGGHAHTFLQGEITPQPDANTSISIRQAQDLVDTWIRTTGVRYFSELTNMAILTEEVGEVARLMSRLYGDQSFKPSDKGKELADELADVLWVLLCIANQTGVDLTAALEKNFIKKNVRDGERHKGNEKLK